MRCALVLFSTAALVLCAAVPSITSEITASRTVVVPLPVATDGRLDVSSFAGKVVYLDFWASWCEPCRKSFPWMNAMFDRYSGDGLVILAVNVDSDRERALAFLDDARPDFPIAWDEGKRVASAYDLEGMPSTFVFDREGTLRISHVGFRDRDRDTLEESIRELLAAVPAGESQ
jgi:cytochrome c biogenesis protein CcmG/thiol:disulfide interchange protein DsbE